MVVKIPTSVGYLTTLSVSRLYSVDDRMLNERELVAGMITGRGNKVLGENSTKFINFHQISHMT
jgi:hypothetical protein